MAAGTLMLAVSLTAPPALAAADQAPSFNGPKTRATVVKVIDGDTIKVRSGGRTYRVQLFTVEAPDEGACFYEEARAGLRRLLPQGSIVTFVRGPNPDPAGRFPAHGLSRDGVFIEAAMAKRGLVEAFENADLDEELATAAGLAQSERRGLFGACSEWPITGPAPQ